MDQAVFPIPLHTFHIVVIYLALIRTSVSPLGRKKIQGEPVTFGLPLFLKTSCWGQFPFAFIKADTLAARKVRQAVRSTGVGNPQEPTGLACTNPSYENYDR